MLLPVIQNVELHNPGAVYTIAASAGPDLVSPEKYPDTRYVACHFSQDPFLSHGHLFKPLAVLCYVLVYHGKQLCRSRSRIRIRKLRTDGAGKGASLRPEGIPHRCEGCDNAAQEKNQTADAANCHLDVIHGFPAGRTLL